jgi:hypothetical protein
VMYQAPKDKTMQYAYYDDEKSKYKSAMEVQNALGRGEIPELYVKSEYIVSVQEKKGIGIA